MRIVVDSSVIIAAMKKDDVFHRESLAFFEEARRRGDTLLAPYIVFWEIGAALDHPVKTPAGSKFERTFVLDLELIVIDEGLF